jgi:hypothetical protein
VVYGDEPRGDEAHYQPIDMKVWDSFTQNGKLIVRIELPEEMTPGTVDHHWTGIFTQDGKPLPGTDFKVASVFGHEIRVEYQEKTIPSHTVRLFHPRS